LKLWVWYIDLQRVFVSLFSELFTMMRPAIRNDDPCNLVRRSLLRLGALGGALALMGCGGAETTVEKPAVEGGNRSKLDNFGKDLKKGKPK
jgi:hypothetical protein